jgi:hypothetical protein
MKKLVAVTDMDNTNEIQVQVILKPYRMISALQKYIFICIQGAQRQ